MPIFVMAYIPVLEKICMTILETVCIPFLLTVLNACSCDCLYMPVYSCWYLFAFGVYCYVLLSSVILLIFKEVLEGVRELVAETKRFGGKGT